MADLNIFIAFAAGILSFASPCLLPVIPGFLAYLTGSSTQNKISRKETFLSSLFFVLGFSAVFAALGVLLNTALESVSYDVQVWLSRIGGLVIIIFALQVMGLIRIPWLMQEHRSEIKRFKSKHLTSFVFGASFAVGWSPCVGALLGSVFALAVSQPGNAFFLLVAYGLGIGLPFLVVGFFADKIFLVIKKSAPFLKIFNWVVGIFLLILGALVFTNNLNLVASFLLPQGVIG